MTESPPANTPKQNAMTPARRPSAAREDPEQFRRDFLAHILYTCVKEPKDAGPVDLCRAMAHSVRDRLVERWLATQRTYVEHDVKRLHYLSAEFLTGRSLGLCLVNLGLYRVAEDVAASMGHDLAAVLEAEGDPGLGNGGLGRLAACFMDSLATLELPAVGYGIRYEHGIFEQRIEGGQQVEHTDNWLQFGNPWELPRHDRTQLVRLYGTTEIRKDAHGRVVVDWVNARSVLGVPYDSFIVGHETDNVNTLRLWSAKASRDFDLRLFNEGDYLRAVEEKVEVENISKVLYPNDQTEHGKELRLKQQYFFVACSIADIVSEFKRAGHSDLRLLPDRAAIQLNDTHPAIAVAELMRVLVDDEGLDWDTSWDITQRCVAYTNHTLMPEALERWPAWMLQRVLPRHLMIIYEINHRFMRQVNTRWPTDPSRMTRMSIIEEGPVQHVRMAHLAALGSHSINGVAKLHSELIKRELFPDFYELFPERFNNKTNGVTPRRWFLYSNPALAHLLAERFGPRWMDRASEHAALLRAHADDPSLLDSLGAIKAANKRALAAVLLRVAGVQVDPTSMFIAQIKRIHEYKRQLLACLEAISHYLHLKTRGDASDTPRVYIFAGKAAAGYATAKLHIRLINDVATVINADPDTKDRLKIVFVPNYGVSLAQSIIPAIDLSLQISQAGKEASGTSNMKLALNGALTVGTLDGANVEIREQVGADNFFLCGQTHEEVQALGNAGYDPAPFIGRSSALGNALALLETGFFSLGDENRYMPVVNYLRYSDPYMVCADFDSYAAEMRAAALLYRSPREWARKSLFNIVGASAFSSDATIRAYARDIWGIVPVTAEVTASARKSSAGPVPV